MMEKIELPISQRKGSPYVSLRPSSQLHGVSYGVRASRNPSIADSNPHQEIKKQFPNDFYRTGYRNESLSSQKSTRPSTRFVYNIRTRFPYSDASNKTASGSFFHSRMN